MQVIERAFVVAHNCIVTIINIIMTNIININKQS